MYIAARFYANTGPTHLVLLDITYVYSNEIS